MKIMSLGAKQGDMIKFSIEGSDETASLTAIKEFVEARL